MPVSTLLHALAPAMAAAMSQWSERMPHLPRARPGQSKRAHAANRPEPYVAFRRGRGQGPRLPERSRNVEEKLQEIEQRFERLTADLGNPEVIGDRSRFSQVAKERSQLEQLVETFREYKRAKADLEGKRALLEDPDAEVRAMAREEMPVLQARVDGLNERLKILLLPRDPNDDRGVILEVRAGAGGDEAGLFAQELLRMYLRYAERKGWNTTLMDSSDNAAGGLKDASVTIEGDGVFSYLKYESGVHRVQRVPATEAQGRIHTSTATVSVLP